jgi:hypothetical protein
VVTDPRRCNAFRRGRNHSPERFLRVGGTIDTIFCFMCQSRAVCAVFPRLFRRRIDICLSGQWVRTLRGTALPSREELKKSQAAKTTKSRSKDRDVGSALRTIYQKTVDETIPDDLLDLLGKLD